MYHDIISILSSTRNNKCIVSSSANSFIVYFLLARVQDMKWSAWGEDIGNKTNKTLFTRLIKMECYFFECTHVCNRYNIIDHNGGKKNKKMYFLFLKIAFSSLSNSSLYHDTTRHGLYFLSASNQLPTNLTRPEMGRKVNLTSHVAKILHDQWSPIQVLS